jgi:hypothetical protein
LNKVEIFLLFFSAGLNNQYVRGIQLKNGKKSKLILTLKWGFGDIFEDSNDWLGISTV